MTTVDFRKALRQQLAFIASSCQAFDNGCDAEAIRIAQCVRVLVHDTSHSTSILAHLKARKIKLVSTVDDFGAKAVVFDPHPPFCGLPQARHVKSSLVVEEWWNQVVMIVRGLRITRRNIVLGTANKFGGAHVDPDLSNTPELATMKFDAWSGGWKVLSEPAIPFTEHNHTHLRYIGFEILQSSEILALT